MIIKLYKYKHIDTFIVKYILFNYYIGNIMNSSIQSASSGFWGIPANELKEALSSGQIKTIFKDIKVTKDEQFIELEQFFLR